MNTGLNESSSASYSTKLEQELSAYNNVLDVHALPEIFSYWSNKHLRPKFESFGFSNPNQFYVDYISRMATLQSRSNCTILSVGAGNCDTEVILAQLLIQRGMDNFCFDCLDLNSEMLARGRLLAAEQTLSSHFDFIEADINGWTVEKSYHVIIANQSLHHFVELELLFDKIWQSLTDDGVFLTNDMIGRNGHMRWPEALELVQACWSLLDDKHKWNRQLNRREEVYENWDCSVEGFEGVRSQDILPLLLERFGFELFLGFSNLINVFVDRAFGHNFDAADQKDLSFIDFVAGLDDYFIEAGRLTPTQMIAAMTKNRDNVPRIYKHLTPQFCLHKTDCRGAGRPRRDLLIASREEQCSGEEETGTSVASPSGNTAAMLTASPNPVPAGATPGTTTIKWTTAGSLTAQIYVSTNGGPEALFASGGEGSFEAPWIQTGMNYEFRLYAGTEHTDLLARLPVTREK